MFESYLELANNPLVESSCLSDLKKRNETQAKRIEGLRKNNQGLLKRIDSQKKRFKKIKGFTKIGRVRETIYKRDNYRCLRCGSKKHLTIDHIVPRSQGGSNDIDNLQTLCFRCNGNKGDKYIDYRKR